MDRVADTKEATISSKSHRVPVDQPGPQLSIRRRPPSKSHRQFARLSAAFVGVLLLAVVVNQKLNRGGRWALNNKRRPSYIGRAALPITTNRTASQ
mmetsp:Transcript_38298/g.70267  ORF Transcript_38298/g.70267 Transcript_38298/m.70267 type:complete len:96 (+) Transcript_38298:894-1181(+)